MQKSLLLNQSKNRLRRVFAGTTAFLLIGLTMCLRSCQYVFGYAFVCASSKYSEILEQEYYADEKNFTESIGTVESIEYYDSGVIYLTFSELTIPISERTFRIFGKNAEIVLKNGIRSKIQPGTEVHFWSGTKVFGNGYTIPIVALSVQGDSLLDFKEGRENLCAALDE